MPAATAIEFYLVPRETGVTKSGDGQAIEVPPSGPRLFVIRMDITQVVEQESLELSIWASADGQNWGLMPLLKFPQRFYAGATQMVLDLNTRPEVRYLRAHWELNRWGRVRPEPLFGFQVTCKPAEAPRA
ncbi:MAG: hypothetical protein HY656_05690 [Acidobacteria bacterium]|nr:hypothetical protein [Acidobacteriota bacterium]